MKTKLSPAKDFTINGNKLLQSKSLKEVVTTGIFIRINEVVSDVVKESM